MRLRLLSLIAAGSWKSERPSDARTWIHPREVHLFISKAGRVMYAGAWFLYTRETAPLGSSEAAVWKIENGDFQKKNVNGYPVRPKAKYYPEPTTSAG